MLVFCTQWLESKDVCVNYKFSYIRYRLMLIGRLRKGSGRKDVWCGSAAYLHMRRRTGTLTKEQDSDDPF
jgi:hypothetical protein